MKRSKKVSILIFSAYMPPHVGGVERYTESLSKELVKLGYQVIVVTSNYNGKENTYIDDGVTIVRLPVYSLFKNRYPIIKFNKEEKELIKKLDDYDIKAVIVNTRFYITSLIGVRYGSKNNIPVYLIEHGSNYVTLDNKFIDFFANRYEDMLSYYLKNKVNGFYGVSNACGKWLSNFGIEASGTWYNSIDMEQTVPEKAKHKEINFLYAGRVIKQKGVYNILESFSNLALKYDNIHLYIAGDGPELDNYKENFTNERIHFLGKLDYSKLLEYYALCDIFLYPTYYPEGLPTTIIEAGMMKCAVIGRDRGGTKEIIQNNESGLIIGEKNTDLESAMEKLILDSKLRVKFANNLYDTVKNNFSWEVTAKKLVKDIKLK